MLVRAKTRCFVRNVFRQEGEEFEYSGPSNNCLEEIAPVKAVRPLDVEDLPAGPAEKAIETVFGKPANKPAVKKSKKVVDEDFG